MKVRFNEMLLFMKVRFNVRIPTVKGNLTVGNF